MAAPLTPALATQWIFDGSAHSLLNGVREEAQARHNLAQEALAIRPAGRRRQRFACMAHVAFVLVVGGTGAPLSARAWRSHREVFCLAPTAPNAIRISLGSIKERKRLASGLRRLSQLLARRPASFGKTVI